MNPGSTKGFVSLYLIAGIGVAVLLAALGIQTARLGAAQQEIGIQKTATEQALNAVERLSIERRAAEKALEEREYAHKEIARLRRSQEKRLQEIERAQPETVEALDCVVPVSVRNLLHERTRPRGSPADPHPPNPPPPLPPPGG